MSAGASPGSGRSFDVDVANDRQRAASSLRMRVEPASAHDLPAIRAAYADARAIQREQRAILWPEFSDESILAEIESGRLFLVRDAEALAESSR